MYEYKCWLCGAIDQVSDEWQVRQLQIPIYVKKYMETKTEVRELCNDCYHKIKYNQELNTYNYVRFIQIKRELFSKIKELKNREE